MLVGRFFFKKNGSLNRQLSICSFNCHGAKSSLPEIQCALHDIVCQQEHWHLPFELNILSHVDFLAVHMGDDIMTGRPYECTDILYNRNFAKAINIINSN